MYWTTPISVCQRYSHSAQLHWTLPYLYILGRVLFPAAGYLYLAWDVFAEEYKVQDALAVTFEDVKFIRATSILPSDPVTLMVVISDSGYFEITERDSIVVTGHIKEIPEENKAYYKLPKPVEDDHKMDAKDIYKELRLRGYNYQ